MSKKESELRHRKVGSEEDKEKPTPKEKETVEKSGGSKGGSASSASAKQSLYDFWDKIQPLIGYAMEYYTIAFPYIMKGKKQLDELWVKAKPYYDQYYVPEMSQLLLGLVLIFFGGHFAMTIACYTALQLSGWKLIKTSWQKIRNNYESGLEAAKNDEAVRSRLDSDGDGNISGEEVLSGLSSFWKADTKEKMEMLKELRTVITAIDPNEVMNGFVGIWSACLCVLATLRSRFAKDVALGVSLGEQLSSALNKYVKPIIEKHVEDDLKQWADFVFRFLCRSIGISFALIIARAISAFHSAMQGGKIIANVLLHVVVTKDIVSKATIGLGEDVEPTTEAIDAALAQSPIHLGVQCGLGLYGFWTQLRTGFAVSFWLFRLLLLPFTTFEVILTYLAAYS